MNSGNNHISAHHVMSSNGPNPSLLNATSGGGLLQNNTNTSLNPNINHSTRSPPVGYPSVARHHSMINDEDEMNGADGVSPMTIRQVNQVSSALRSANQTQRSQGVTLPSEKQLLQLVQQIQLAVQTGHLNAQVGISCSLRLSQY